jgi:AcrR family transcriptional regulator
MSFETSESDGPDPYVVPGFSLQTELEWLVKSGFSPMQALQSATFNLAGVGAGTLYRHFPTRDALIQAVYRSEVEKLAMAERKFAETMSPIDALRTWMLLFVDHIAAKQIIAPALNSIVGGATKLYEGSHGLIHGAIDALVKRAIKSGDIRRDLEPFDLLRALIGVAHVASGPGWKQSARRLVDILITGSRPVK